MPSKTHGYTGTRIYQAYLNMKARCYYKKGREYNNYGGRGITVCEEWLGNHGAENFINWAYMNGYNDNLTLDRIDVNKGYSPNNCRWITNQEQQNNRRNNHYITYKGRTQTLKQWSEEIGISSKSLEKRLRVWKDIDRAIETPIQKVFYNDLRGMKFNRLTVLDFAEKPEHLKNCRQKFFLCRCDCGTLKVIRGTDIKKGTVKSCGCFQKERASRKKGEEICV